MFSVYSGTCNSLNPRRRRPFLGNSLERLGLQTVIAGLLEDRGQIRAATAFGGHCLGQ